MGCTNCESTEPHCEKKKTINLNHHAGKWYITSTIWGQPRRIHEGDYRSVFFSQKLKKNQEKLWGFFSHFAPHELCELKLDFYHS